MHQIYTIQSSYSNFLSCIYSNAGAVPLNHDWSQEQHTNNSIFITTFIHVLYSHTATHWEHHIIFSFVPFLLLSMLYYCLFHLCEPQCKFPIQVHSGEFSRLFVLHSRLDYILYDDLCFSLFIRNIWSGIIIRYYIVNVFSIYTLMSKSISITRIILRTCYNSVQHSYKRNAIVIFFPSSDGNHRLKIYYKVKKSQQWLKWCLQNLVPSW